MDLSRHARIALGLAVAALITCQVIALWPFTVDDTYITLRYARNLARGLGPVFQAGLPRAEGCTSVLWLIVLAIPHRLGWDALAFAKALGVILTLAWLALAARTAARAVRAESGDSLALAAVITGAALAALPMTGVHAVSGMETAAFALAVLALAADCARLVRSGGVRTWTVPLIALVSGLLRPEGNLLALAGLVATAAALAPAARARLARDAVLMWLVPGAAYFAWRWSYYGQPLPLPFYVKMAAPGALLGLPNVGRFLITVTPMLLLALPALWRLRRDLLPPLLIATTLIVFAIFPEHVMGFFMRFLFPAAGPLAVLAGVGASRGMRWLRGRVAPALGAAALIGVALVPLGDLKRAIDNRLIYARNSARAHVALGRRLATLPAGTVALSDAGAIPYLSDWRTIDLVGLNDAHIARTRDRSPEYVFSQRPDVLVLVSQEADRFRPLAWNPYELELLLSARQRGFEPVARYTFSPVYVLWVLARPTDPRAALLAHS